MEYDIYTQEIEERKQWENWLGPGYGQDLEKIKNSVRNLYKENTNGYRELAYFTLHDTSHCAAVENLLHKLIPYDSLKLNLLKEAEIFYLLASAWLHDLGMLRLVVEAVYGSEIDYSDSQVRELHHETTEKFISNHFERCGVKEQDKEILGILCRYHRRREDISYCPESIDVGTNNYKVRILAAYLRLADALHIGTSRTPLDAYSICLTYSIPTSAKLHWIKSMFVLGIRISPKTNYITIDIKIPYKDMFDNKSDMEWKEFNTKVKRVVNFIQEDLREELFSISNILIENKLSSFLDIKIQEVEVCMPDQMFSDLCEVVMNFEVLSNPSASKLIELVLKRMLNIVGYQNDENDDNSRGQLYFTDDKIKKLREFVDTIEEEVLMNRPCHLGLIRLVKNCKEILNKEKKSPQKDINKFIEEINAIKKNHEQSRTQIILNSREFFDKEFLVDSKEKLNSNETYLTILLYGFSELVIKALCGIRDSIIREMYKFPEIERQMFHNTIFEKEAAEKIRIFICEGRPKTQTRRKDKIIFHDGTRYAIGLANRNFKNLIIIPDIVVDNVLDKYQIDLFMVGANGIQEKNFTHSAGHSSIIRLVREKFKNGYITSDLETSKTNKSGRIPTKIVLVTSTEKWNEKCERKEVYIDRGEPYEIEGYHFWSGTKSENVRNNIWITRDESIRTSLYNNKIMLYNPKEDIIPIEYVDTIISDHQPSADTKSYYLTLDEKNREEFARGFRQQSNRYQFTGNE